MKTYNIRLFPDINQVTELLELSSIRNNLWNTLIDIEELEYKTNKKIVHNYELDKRITELRKQSDLSKLNSKACQRISKEIYSSYQSFFRLIQKDKTARPPRKMEDTTKFHTIVFNQSGWIINSNNEITINKIKFKYKSHLDIINLDIKELRIKFVNNKWLCDICVNENIIYDDIIKQDNKVLAIDLGLKTLGTCVDNKGNVIIIKNKSKQISKYYLKQIGKVQNKLSKTVKGSKRNIKLKDKVRELYNKKNKQVKQTLHTQSKELLGMNYKCIVIGDLSVKTLMSNGNGKYNGLNKSFHQSNIAMFVDMLKYKSYSHKTDIIKINESYTTQLNCLTGKQFKNKITLNDRIVKLNDDIEIDRDLNASINILERYFNNHIAAMTQPLDKSSVIHRFNLMNKSSQYEKPMVL